MSNVISEWMGLKRLKKEKDYVLDVTSIDKAIKEMINNLNSLKLYITFGDKIRKMNNKEMARELALVANWDKEEVDRLKAQPGGIEKWIEEYLNERFRIEKTNSKEREVCKNCRSSD